MEEAGILSRVNDIHLFVLHFVFLPRINRGLGRLTSAWNNHPIRTERNWSPLQIWTIGMVDIWNNRITGILDVTHGTAIDDLEWFGYDPDAPAPSEDGLSVVQVEDVNVDLTDPAPQELFHEVDPLQYSDSFAINVYQEHYLWFYLPWRVITTNCTTKDPLKSLTVSNENWIVRCHTLRTIILLVLHNATCCVQT